MAEQSPPPQRRPSIVIAPTPAADAPMRRNTSFPSASAAAAGLFSFQPPTPYHQSASLSGFSVPTAGPNDASSAVPPPSTPSLMRLPSNMSAVDLSRVPSHASLSSLPTLSPTSSQQQAPAHADQFSESWPVNSFVSRREGEILSSNLILKSDRYPGVYTDIAANDVHISGAPNFRQIRDLPLYGVAQPSAYGIQTILNRMHPRGVQWINLREEPVIYLNNRPFVLRELAHPFRNMHDFAGVHPARLEEIEQQLKDDILKEAQRNNGNLLVHQETSNMNVMACFEAVSAQCVQTSRDIYTALQSAAVAAAGATHASVALSFGNQSQLVGAPASFIEYQRIPVTAENVPSPIDIDAIVQCVRRYANAPLSAQPNTIFNCQMGRGRSTFGTIAVCLMQCGDRLLQQQPLSVSHSAANELLPRPVQQLLRFLPHGMVALRQVDAAVAWCGRVVNVRDDIRAAAADFEAARTEQQRRQTMRKLSLRIERYFYLICLAEYLLSVEWRPEAVASPSASVESPATFASCPPLPEPLTFAAWLRERPEIRRIAGDFNPSAADHAVSTVGSGSDSGGTGIGAFGAADDAKITPAFISARGDAAMEAALLRRRGAVLSAQSILKTVPLFAGVASANHDQSAIFGHPGQNHHALLYRNQQSRLVDGAPNFRQLTGTSIFCSAQPSVTGIRNVLALLGAAPADSGSGSLQLARSNSNVSVDGVVGRTGSVLWINMCEEASLFVADVACTLRDAQHPFRSLPEFRVTAMPRDRLELLEQRLVDEVRAEAKRGNGRLLVHEERARHELQSVWVGTAASDASALADATGGLNDAALVSGRGVFDALSSDGYRVQYRRIPLVVDSVPDVDAIDALFATLIQPDVLLTHGARCISEDQPSGVAGIDGGDGGVGEVSIVFQCYQGHRRSAVGMAVACLVRHNHERLCAAADATGTDSDRANVDDANTGTFADLVKSGSAQSDHGGVASPAADADLVSPAAASVMSPDASVPPVSASGAPSDEGALEDVRSVVITVSSGDGRVSIHSAGRSSLALAASPTGSSSASPALGAAPVDANTDSALPLFALAASATDPSSSVAIPATASGANSMAKTPSSSNLQQLQHQHQQQLQQQHQQRGNFRGMIGLCRMLKHGRAVKDEVDAVLDACGGTVYIHDAIERSRTQWEAERDETLQRAQLQDAMNALQSYCMLVIFNAFLHDYFHTPSAVPRFPSFASWVASRPELRVYLESLAKSPEDALRLDLSLLSAAGDENAAVYAQRRGNVLLNTSILKCDYFQGCQNPKLPLRVDGAANCRFLTPHLLLGGTAMPTGAGIESVLGMLPTLSTHALTNQAVRSVRWVCLREEPVVYVCHRPFVLRDLARPYSNLEYTGINTRRVEAMEKQLKRDVLAEAAKYGGRLLLHDENAAGSLVGTWTDVGADEIKTTKETYVDAMTRFATRELRHATAAGVAVANAGGADSAASSPGGAERGIMRIVYSRVPITDEQSPSVDVFDWFAQHVESAADGRFLLFNCQMGRGRTTTAMVMAALVTLQRPNGAVSFDHVEAMLRAASANGGAIGGAGYAPPVPVAVHLPTSAQTKSATGADAAAAAITPEQTAAYERGEFRVVLRLLRLLENEGGGALCKAQVDRVLDACAQMQNLREAIWSTKVRADRSLQSHQREEGNHRALAYLVRYVYLLLFNSFLLVEVKHAAAPSGSGTVAAVRPSFADFLARRPALLHCLEDISLK